jgi:hypothetical protein
VARKQSAQEWIEKELGAKATKELFKKIERLEKHGATSAEIEEIITLYVTKHIRGRIVGHIIAYVRHIKTKR